MRTIAVVNQKGGCGKTITSINLSAFLAVHARRVLLIDLDPQGHATLGVLSDAVQPAATVAEIFRRESAHFCRLDEIIHPVADNFDVVPADILLSAAPERLAGVDGRENVLSAALDGLAGQYDYVIVDCPPQVGLLTFNAVKACAEAIVPMDPSFFALHGVGKLLETFEVVARETGHRIAARALVTLHYGRSAFARAVVDDIRRHLAGRHFETIIRYSVKLGEAASHGIPIAQYSERSTGFEDYKALAREVIAMETGAVLGAHPRVERDAIAVSHPEPDAERQPEPEAEPELDSEPVALTAAAAAPSLTPDGVVFLIEAPHAGRVQLVGDFNAWGADGNDMEPAGPIWRKVVKLQPGRYRYRYVVDGQWQSDPLNALAEPCPYGGQNSILQFDEQTLALMGN